MESAGGIACENVAPENAPPQQSRRILGELQAAEEQSTGGDVGAVKLTLGAVATGARMRRPRAESPAPQAQPPDEQRCAGTLAVSAAPAAATPPQQSALSRRLAAVFGALLLACLALSPLASPSLAAGAAAFGASLRGKVFGDSSGRPLRDVLDVLSVAGGGDLSTSVARALHCPRARAELLDILAGAPVEFGVDVTRPELLHLRQLAVDVGFDRLGADELAAAVQSLAAFSQTGTQEEAPLRQRIRAALALASPCSDAGAGADAFLALEVDPDFTSPSADTPRGWWHRLLLSAGAATGLRRFRERADLFRPRPATVVTSPGAAEAGDCLALRGPSPSLALRLQSGAALVKNLLIEQPPRWTTPATAPRRFAVYGEPVMETADAERTSSPHSLKLGSFEYLLAAPAKQAFHLASAPPLRSLRLVFEGPGWGDDFLCVYRIRATGQPESASLSIVGGSE
eukprot:TRINITY_DN40407_c0_g1_i1.p1 TRINITY_DN40407_c0_g1~~TRINITY_DN40407_c0_g1_i1.p1  ORF type:complete len:458 (-),score=101.27 TRINITY_DN40407_c0_g1_i1:152-1525(-)